MNGKHEVCERTGGGRAAGLALLAAALLVATGWIAGAPATAGAAQGGGDGADPGVADALFLDRVEVNLVNIEAFVTDRSGRRVTDLARQDFSVTVDGEPVEITHFHAGRAVPAEDDEAPAASEPRVAAATSGEVPPTGTDDAVRRPLHLVIHFDNRQIAASNRKRVIDELAEMIPRRVAAGDSVMLTSFANSLEVVQPLTRDADALATGLRRIAKQATFREIEDRKHQSALYVRQVDIQGPSSSGSEGAIAGGAAARLDSRRQIRVGEAQASARALGGVLDSLAGLPGRKALMLVSDGFPLASSPFSEETGSQGAERPLAGERPLRLTYANLGQRANAAEVTVYAFDARGSNPSLGGGADVPDLWGVANPGSISVNTPAIEFHRNAEMREPLFDLALATGGRAVINTFNFEGAVGDVVDDFGAYYSLGFPSPVDDDGRYHRVEVKVNRPGVTVRHRHGYFSKPPEVRVAERAQSFLVQGWQSNPMGAELQFAEPKKNRRDSYRVPVLVRIPSASLTLLPRGDELVGKVQIFVATRDSEGRESEITRISRDVSVPAEAEGEAAGGDVGYALEVDMRSGSQDLLVAVWDEIGGNESYLAQTVVVGDRI